MLHNRFEEHLPEDRDERLAMLTKALLTLLSKYELPYANPQLGAGTYYKAALIAQGNDNITLDLICHALANTDLKST